jgi:hypothetical protein
MSAVNPDYFESNNGSEPIDYEPSYDFYNSDIYYGSKNDVYEQRRILKDYNMIEDPGIDLDLDPFDYKNENPSVFNDPYSEIERQQNFQNLIDPDVKLDPENPDSISLLDVLAINDRRTIPEILPDNLAKLIKEFPDSTYDFEENIRGVGDIDFQKSVKKRSLKKMSIKKKSPKKRSKKLGPRSSPRSRTKKRSRSKKLI